VHCLSWTDAKDNAQNLGMRDSLGQLWVKASPALLNGAEVKTRCVGDRLDMILRRQVVIVSWNCRMLPFVQTRDRLIERVAEIGVLGAAAISRPPTRVYRELHKIGKPPYLLRSCRFAAG